MIQSLQLRMYFFVPYNLSPIQQGIQAGHAALEYANEYGNTDLFKDFVKNHKTWIILNGGTTNNSSTSLGSLNEIEEILKFNNIKYSSFFEPDLNNALTALCFICDERVFDKEKYPDISLDYHNAVNVSFEEIQQFKKDFEDTIGGKENFILRELLSNKKLA